MSILWASHLGIRYAKCKRWQPCPAWVTDFAIRDGVLIIRCDLAEMRAAGKYVSAATAQWEAGGHIFEGATMSEGGGTATLRVRRSGRDHE